jgi:Flp pilus assembly protein TadG
MVATVRVWDGPPEFCGLRNAEEPNMRLRRESRRRNGTSAVEMAVVAPLLIALIMGQIESSRLGMVTQLLTTAAREGCRVAVINGNTQANVQARVDAVLDGSGIDVGTVTPTPSGWATVATGTPITVSFDIPYSRVSWLPTPYYLKSAHIRVSATMNRE